MPILQRIRIQINENLIDSFITKITSSVVSFYDHKDQRNTDYSIIKKTSKQKIIFYFTFSEFFSSLPIDSVPGSILHTQQIIN